MADEKKQEEVKEVVKEETTDKTKKADSSSTEKEAKKTESSSKPDKKDKKSSKKTAKKKPRRRMVEEGKAYIQASFNNTIITITDLEGAVLSWSSAGANGFKGPKKATPYAAQISAEKAAEKAKAYGVERVHVIVKGAGNGREQSIRGLLSGGINVESLKDITAIPHNGCRKPKTRRV